MWQAQINILCMSALILQLKFRFLQLKSRVLSSIYNMTILYIHYEFLKCLWKHKEESRHSSNTWQSSNPLHWVTVSQEQQLEPDIEQWIGSKLGKEYVKAVFCHPAYLTYMQSISCEMSGWMNHSWSQVSLKKQQ